MEVCLQPKVAENFHGIKYINSNIYLFIIII